MNYFKYFPRVAYRFTANNSNWSVAMTNITCHAILLEKVKQQVSAFHPYVVQDGDRPDTVATKLYGGPEYTWIILVVNNILTLFDWPLTEYEFNRYINRKYGSQAAAEAITYYLTTDGQYVDATTYALLPIGQKGSTRSAWEDESLKNETKRTIRVVPRQFVPLLQAELEQAFQ
jgi:hypothetical protein